MEMNAVGTKFILFDETEQYNSSFVNRNNLYPSLVGMQKASSSPTMGSIAPFVKSPAVTNNTEGENRAPDLRSFMNSVDAAKQQQESLEELKKQNKELQQNNITLKQAHISLQRELDILKSKVAVEEESAEHQKRLEQAEKELAALKLENEKLKSELTKTKEERVNIVPPKLVIPEKPKEEWVSLDQHNQQMKVMQDRFDQEIKKLRSESVIAIQDLESRFSLKLEEFQHKLESLTSVKEQPIVVQEEKENVLAKSVEMNLQDLFNSNNKT